MFEVNGEYANRKGKYTVLAIDTPKMQVRYEDGSHAELNMDIQGRIWENILAEREAQEARASRNAEVLLRGAANTRFFVKSVSLPAVDEMTFPGWQERVVMASNPIQASRIRHGDRIIYYAIEADTFFAVATVTGEAFAADPKEFFYTVGGSAVSFFPIDVDVAAFTPDQGIVRDSVELEEYRDFKRLLAQPETFFAISEDDFELLAELITELGEAENNGVEDEDFEEEDEE